MSHPVPPIALHPERGTQGEHERGVHKGIHGIMVRMSKKGTSARIPLSHLILPHLHSTSNWGRGAGHMKVVHRCYGILARMSHVPSLYPMHKGCTVGMQRKHKRGCLGWRTSWLRCALLLAPEGARRTRAGSPAAVQSADGRDASHVSRLGSSRGHTSHSF